MVADLKCFNCRKIYEESKVAFSKSFQSESPKLSDENLEFLKSRSSFFKQNNLNLP